VRRVAIRCCTCDNFSHVSRGDIQFPDISGPGGRSLNHWQCWLDGDEKRDPGICELLNENTIISVSHDGLHRKVKITCFKQHTIHSWYLMVDSAVLGHKVFGRTSPFSALWIWIWPWDLLFWLLLWTQFFTVSVLCSGSITTQPDLRIPGT